jgi:hypothetical protein
MSGRSGASSRNFQRQDSAPVGVHRATTTELVISPLIVSRSVLPSRMTRLPLSTRFLTT